MEPGQQSSVRNAGAVESGQQAENQGGLRERTPGALQVTDLLVELCLRFAGHCSSATIAADRYEWREAPLGGALLDGRSRGCWCTIRIEIQSGFLDLRLEADPR